MNITKRDIADIVLVVMAISFVLALSRSIFSLGYAAGNSDDLFKGASITCHVANILLLLFVNYALLFKRSLILAIVFPDGRDKELIVPEGLTALTSYSFWIRLFAVFFFLKSLVSLVSQLIRDLIINAKFPDGSFAWNSCMYSLVSVVLTTIIIWKSDWIATKIENIKSSNQSNKPT